MRTSAKEKRIREEVPIALERMGFRNGEPNTWLKDEFVVQLKTEKVPGRPTKQYVLEIARGGQIVRKLNAARLWQRSLERLLLAARRAKKRQLRERGRLSAPHQNCENDELRKTDISPMKRSEFTTPGCVRCRGFGIATKWLPGVGPVCPECELMIGGRATPAATDENLGCGSEAQLALFES